MLIVLSDSVLLQTEAVRAETISRLLNGYGIATSEEQTFEYLYDTDDTVALQLIRERFGRFIPEGLDYQLANLSGCWNKIDIRTVKYARDFVVWLPRPSCIMSSLTEKSLAASLSKVALDPWLETHIFICNSSSSEDSIADSYADIVDLVHADPRHCVVAAHSSAQVRAAKLAGMRAVGFLGGSSSPTWHGGALLSAGADEIVCDLHNLKKSIARFQSYIYDALSRRPDPARGGDFDGQDESPYGIHSNYW
ncbi:MAG: HAD family phosphatase [Bradyrhizobiaceae bacterium]|nr:MAG: HAD family phosphatase [Bradyrhizobiaceae bacterium]